MAGKQRTRSVYFPEGFEETLDEAERVAEAAGYSMNQAFLEGLKLYIEKHRRLLPRKLLKDKQTRLAELKTEIGELLLSISLGTSEEGKELERQKKAKLLEMELLEEEIHQLEEELDRLRMSGRRETAKEIIEGIKDAVDVAYDACLDPIPDDVLDDDENREK